MSVLRIDDGPPEMTPAPIRIDVWRAGRVLLLALVIPMTAAVAIDLTLGTLPFAIIAAVVVCIPLATILVSRTVLAEFDRVIAVVAPPESEEQAPEEQGPATGTAEAVAPVATAAPAAQGPSLEFGLKQGQDLPGDAGVSGQAR